MNRATTARTTGRHLAPRTTILSGAALGLVVGAAVYGAVSSSAESPISGTFKAKVPVAVPRAAASCTGTAKLEKGVCVVHIVRTVVAPPVGGVAPARAVAVPVASHVPTSTVRPGPSAAGSAAAPSPTSAPKAPATLLVAPTKAPVAAVARKPQASPTTAPVPGSTPSPTATPVPTAAS